MIISKEGLRTREEAETEAELLCGDRKGVL